MTINKPRTRDGYTPEDLASVISACLTFAVTVGAHMEELCIVGGLVPSLLIDHRLGTAGDAAHPGTNDLDVGLDVAVLDDHGYQALSTRLRAEDFEPIKNVKGNTQVQTWAYAGTKVTVDFLMPPIPDGPPPARVQNLEGDFGALIIPGIELAAGEREIVTLEGHTFAGERVTRDIPVCGPATFTVLKALAFAQRGEPKDAFDLVYVLRGWNDMDDIVQRLIGHAAQHGDIVARALTDLARDFQEPTNLGPLRAAGFDTLRASELDDAAADAHGYVDDLLRRCRTAGLRITRDG
jgi:Nucleotidyl transferase AbiEii toxin, Type IV TA system